MASRLNTAVTGGSPNLLGSLTAAARPLPEDADWTAFGVSYTPENCGKAWVWQECTEATDDDPKPLNTGVDAVTFKPFLIEFNAASCDGGIAGDWDQLSARAKRGLDTRTSRGIALALSSSAPDGVANDSPNLPGSATDVTPGSGPASIVNTITGLLQDSVDCGANGELFIHAPHWTLPHILKEFLVTQIGSVFKVGPHTLVLDQGYTNEEPTGADPAGDGEAWIYVTGPVEFAKTPVQPLDDTSHGFQTRLNSANVIAAQLAIYRFDPCCVFAAKAKVC